MPTIIAAHTQAGDDRTDNEDWYAATDDLVVVLDGATIRTDTGCVHGLPWYVRQLGAAIVASAQNHDYDLRQVLADAISTVAALHADTCDLTHPGTPSAAAGIVRLGHGTVDWLVLGDITVLVDAEDGLAVFTDNRVSQTGLAERRECDRYLIGTAEKATALLEMKRVELAARNTAGGYWIASTDPAAVDHAHVDSVPRARVLRFAVCSDGAMRALALTSISTHDGIMAILRGSGPAALIDLVRNAERHDPLGKRVPRNKATDDATAVFADLNVAPPAHEITEAARQAAIREVTTMTNSVARG